MEKQDYLDFELEIGPGRGRQYPVAVIRSPAGEARETMYFPFGELALQNRLQALQLALLYSGGKRRQRPLPEEQAVQDFGQALFNALLSGEVRSRYDVSVERAAERDKGLRLKLHIQPPGLAVLPWEFLYDPRQAEYVCLSRNTPVVRYIELPQAIQPLTVTPPLRILGMIASPCDPYLKELDTENERQRVERAVKDLRVRGLMDLEWLPGQSWRELQRAMRGGPWHIFHFIGHGGFDPATDEGLIVLANDDGRRDELRATELGRLLANHRSLRLALLNSCEGARGSELDIFSSTASILVRRGIPAVLAMQYEITDHAAIEFARAFYEALADRMPVDAAVAEARVAVSLAVTNTVEWGTPVLYMRAPDGRIFNVEALIPEGRAAGAAMADAEAQAQLKHQQAEARKQREEEARQAELTRLYAVADEAAQAKNWSKAIESFQSVLKLDASYQDVPARLAQAREALAAEEAAHQLAAQLARLYAQALAHLQAQRWAEAIEGFRAVLALDPHYSDPTHGSAAALLTRAQQQKDLAELPPPPAGKLRRPPTLP